MLEEKKEYFTFYVVIEPEDRSVGIMSEYAIDVKFEKLEGEDPWEKKDRDEVKKFLAKLYGVNYPKHIYDDIDVKEEEIAYTMENENT